jgi:universal stress protein E
MAERKFERVIVAIKPWQGGLPLEAQHAAQLAEAVGAELMLTSAVFDARIAARAERGEHAAAIARKRTIETERVELERLAKSLRDWGAVVATRVVWEASAYQGILQVASEWRADLLVVGAHERGLHLGTRLTDTDWQLMRLTPCPLLLVKDPVFDGYPMILAAVDPAHPRAAETGIDDAVLAAAKGFAAAFGSKLRAVHAIPEAEAAHPPLEIAPGVYCDSEAIERFRRLALDELLAQHGVDAASLDVAHGKAPAVIEQTVVQRRAALVVIGALRRSRLEQMALGSTAEAVAMDAPCDVLLVPPPAPRAAAVAGDVRDKAKTATPRRRRASSAAPVRPPRPS